MMNDRYMSLHSSVGDTKTLTLSHLTTAINHVASLSSPSSVIHHPSSIIAVPSSIIHSLFTIVDVDDEGRVTARDVAALLAMLCQATVEERLGKLDI